MFSSHDINPHFQTTKFLQAWNREEYITADLYINPIQGVLKERKYKISNPVQKCEF